MKSLRTLRAVATSLAIAVFAACDNPDLLDPAASGNRAELGSLGDIPATCPGKSGGVCALSATVQLDAAGVALLVVRTGGVNEATGVYQPNGTFPKVQWKVFDGRGKLITTKNSDAAGTMFSAALGTLPVGFRVEVEANIDSHAGKKGISVVRASAALAAGVGFDLRMGSLFLLAGEQRIAPGTVDANAVNTYTADITNISSVDSPTLGATNSRCVVSVDGQVQTSGQAGFAFVGGADRHIAPGASEPCTFTLQLPEGQHTVRVTAQAVALADTDASNNSTEAAVDVSGVPGTADVSVASVSLSVDGTVQSGLSSIPKGKVGNYTITFLNSGSGSATAVCGVTAGTLLGLPVSIAVITPNPITIPAGGTATCHFNYVFPMLAAVDFVVSATGVQPDDTDPDDNSFSFQTVSSSDHTFPAITNTNIHALQRTLTDASGNVVQLTEQSTSINRITLTFAAATAVIGRFKLTGSIVSEGRPISSGTWTVNELRPGQFGFPNCVTGVDQGATVVNNHSLRLKICAQEVAGEPGIQAIYVEYESATQGPVASPIPASLFGSEVTFDVTLDWTLNGSTFAGPGYEDRASALLRFALQNLDTGFPNIQEKTQTGQVTVVRNGNGG
jgi:hypothetical protein